jgi:uncharacterized repeat protein (TIGR02543 family)
VKNAGTEDSTVIRVTPPPNRVAAEKFPADPEWAGHVFEGWYAVSAGAGVKFTANTPVTGDMTVYARWTENLPVSDTPVSDSSYSVTFMNNDGTSDSTVIQVTPPDNRVGAAEFPDGPEWDGHVFGGWYTLPDGGGGAFTADTPVTGNMTVYARWTEVLPVPEGTLNQQLQWIRENAVEGGAYVITVKADEAVLPANRVLFCEGKTVSVTLVGDATRRIVSLGEDNGTLFTVKSNVTLSLKNNVTLRGLSGNNAPLIRVNGGALVMDTGSAVSENTTTGGGGGVWVTGSGAFTMNGGEISGNTASGIGGGGVWVSGGGAFTMNGGEISGNTASHGGGGVYASSTFTMNGGEISGNTAHATNGDGGGGVFLTGGGAFTMKDGKISGNTASGIGGGVCMSGAFTMNGGEISGNTASHEGGGVWVTNHGGAFIKTGGIIYGDSPANTTHTPDSTANTATRTTDIGKNGHAVFLHRYVSPNDYCYYRNETLEASDNINTDTNTLPANSGQTVGNWTKR